jgi:hypothetical protein
MAWMVSAMLCISMTILARRARVGNGGLLDQQQALDALVRWCELVAHG